LVSIKKIWKDFKTIFMNFENSNMYLNMIINQAIFTNTNIAIDCIIAYW
jgi:hypothetical protein